MKPDPAENQLREKIWRRELSAAEQAELRAWLAAHPETQSDWETEQGLSRLLSKLPDAPVPSNFTARVLQAVEQSERAEKRVPQPWWLRSWLPRAAAAVCIVGLGLFSYNRYQDSQSRKLANDLAVVAEVKIVPSMDALANFDAIRRLPATPLVDEGLLSITEDLAGLAP